MGPQFFETRMGQKFYDGTMPRVAHALESIATSLELGVQKQNLIDHATELRVLVREAIAIIDTDGAEVDIRDWLKAARAAIGTTT